MPLRRDLQIHHDYNQPSFCVRKLLHFVCLFVCFLFVTNLLGLNIHLFVVALSNQSSISAILFYLCSPIWYLFLFVYLTFLNPIVTNWLKILSLNYNFIKVPIPGNVQFCVFICVLTSLSIGRKPWSRMRLVFKTLWVRILAPDTRWLIFHICLL